MCSGPVQPRFKFLRLGKTTMMRNIVLISALLCLLSVHNGRADESESDLNVLSQFLGNDIVWNSRAAAVRHHFLEAAMLNPLPERNPLNVVRHSRRTYYDYSVENVYFESLPKFYVTGNLYMPLNASGPVPGILHPHGHFPEEGWYARTRPDSQALSAQLARMGMVVFAYDMVGWGDSTQIDHDAWNVLMLQTWDSIRVIDFLQSVPEVDPNRIGVTGASGGGTQSIFVAIADQRIQLSAPVVMVASDYTGDERCEDGLPVHETPGVKTNNAEIAANIAPKPLLIISDGDDWTKHFPKREAPYIQKIYDVVGAPSDRFKNVHFAKQHHDYNKWKRTEFYHFVSHHFNTIEVPFKNNSFTDNWPEEVVIEPQARLVVFDAQHPRPPPLNTISIKYEGTCTIKMMDVTSKIINKKKSVSIVN